MKNSGALPGTRLFCLQWKLSREWKGPFTKDLKIIVSCTGDVPLRSLWQAYEITRREKSDRGHIDRLEHGFWDSAGKLFLMGRRYIVRPPGYPDGLFVSQALRQSRGACAGPGRAYCRQASQEALNALSSASLALPLVNGGSSHCVLYLFGIESPIPLRPGLAAKAFLLFPEQPRGGVSLRQKPPRQPCGCRGGFPH